MDFTLMMGNSDFQYFGTDTRIGMAGDRHNAFLIINGGFGMSGGEQFLGRTLTHLRFVHSISQRIKIETFTQYDNNKKHLLLHRALLGGGLRFEVFKKKKCAFRIGTSLFNEWESYDLTEKSAHDQKTHCTRFSIYFTLLLVIKPDVTLLSTTYLQPALGSSEDFKILSDHAVSIKLWKHLDLACKINIWYDNEPADGIEKFDLVSKFGIALNFE